MSVEKQVVLLFTGSFGYLDDIPIPSIGEFESGFLDYMDSSEHKLLAQIKKEKALSEDLIDKLKKATEEFKRNNYGITSTNQKKN